MPSELDYLFEPTTQTTAVAQNPEFDDLFEPAPQALPTTTNPNLDDLFGPSAPTSTQPAPAVTPEPKKPIKTGQFDPETIIPQIGKGILGGIMKFSTIGKTVKGMGDNYLQKANALNKEIDQEVSNKSINFTFEDIRNGKSGQAPDVRKLLNDRLDFQNNIEALNKSMNEMQDPIARQEIINQINKASMDVTNIDKLIAPSWKNPNEYKNLIEKFNQQRTLTEKANKTFQIGKNLEAKNERILNSFTTAEERDTFAYKLGSGIESMAEAFVTSKGVGALGNALKIAPKAVDVASQVIPGITLALPGAIDMYDKAIGKGVDPKTARMIAAGDLFANAALESVSFGFIFKGPAKGFIKSAITEGSQELAQTFTDNAITKTWIDQNQDLFQGALDSFLIGNIIGGSVGKIRANAEIPIMQNVMMRIKNNPKYQESFKAANMSEQDVDQLLQRVAQKTSEINEVVSEKTFTDEFNKTMGEIGKDQPEDAMRRKPIEGELDLNNPLQIEQAIADKNKFIVENEGNSAMRNMVAIATQERNDLSEKMQEVINRPNIELNPAEITQIQADIKESTGAQISQEQAAAIMREMSDKRVEQIKYQDNLVSDTGKRVQVRDENGDLQGVVGVKSQRRPELVGTNRNAIPKATLQQAADNDLINGYVEGDVKIPGNTEYIYSKAVRENSPELMKKVVDTGPEHIKFVLQGSGFNSVDELSQYATTAEKQGLIDNSPEVQNEVRQTKDLISEIKRIGERVEEAKRSLKQPVEKGGGSSEQRPDTYDNGNQGSAKSFAKVASEKGGNGAKRLDSYLINQFAKNLDLDVIAVDTLGKGAGGGEVMGRAYTDYGIAKIKRSLFEGDWGVVTKSDIGERVFQILKDAQIINENGAVDVTQYNGKLGQLKQILGGVMSNQELEELNSKLLESKNTDSLSEVMSHEIGHLIDAMPDSKIDRGNIVGRVLSEIKGQSKEDINIIGDNATMRKELIGLSEWWSPYDKENAKPAFVKYRNSAPELYAEALSVYINDPAVAKQKAPVFFENFEKNIFRKPGVKEAFAQLDKLRNMDKKALGEYAFNRGKESTMTAENFAKKAYEEKSKKPGMAEKIKAFKDGAMEELAIGDLKIRQLLEKNGYLTNLTDLETVNGKMGKEDYLNLSIRKGWISKPKELLAAYTSLFDQEAFKEYIKPDSNFGQYLVNQRIIHDRSGLANPKSVEAAKAANEHMKTIMTPDQYAQMENDANKYYEFMDNFMKQQVDYGIISQEHYDNIKKNNSKYAFFQVAEKEFQKANAAFGNSVPASIKNQIGTLKDVRNPVASSVDLLNKMGWMMEINRFKLEFANMLKEMPADQDVIREVKPGKNGQVANPDKGYTRLNVLDNSEYKSYDVKTELYEEYDSTIAQLDKIPYLVKLIRPVFGAVKMGLTKLNPAFTVKNPIRDFLDVKTSIDAGIIPGVSSKDLGLYTKNLKEALNISYQAVMNPENMNDLLREAENKGAIIPRDIKWALDEGDALMSGKTTEIMNSLGITLQSLDESKAKAGEADWKSVIKNAVKMVPQKYDKLMTNVNEISENATKLAFYKTLKDKGMSPERAAVYTRRFAGTPDPTYGGKHRMMLGTFFGFFNPTVQGNMRLIHALTRKNGLSGTARAKFIASTGGRLLMQPEVMIGTVLAWALKRLWDKDPKKNPMLRVSDETLKRYFVIPAFGREIRIPRGQMNQVIHEVAWEFLDTVYNAAKGKTNNAEKHMAKLIGAFMMQSGVSYETLTPVLKSIVEANVNRDYKGNEIYNPDSSENVKAQKAMEHIFRNTLGGPVPKNWTMGFVNKFTGDAERLAQASEDYKVAQADMLTEMANIYSGKEVNANKLRKLASKEPSLVSMAEKAIALSHGRKDVIDRIRKGQAQGYARALLNTIKGKNGLQGGTVEIGNIIREAKNVLSQDDFKALMEYIGVFY